MKLHGLSGGQLAVPSAPGAVSWAYTAESSERDLRVDLLRGMAIFALLIVHVEFFSVFNFLAWERVGVVSSAEPFVILSGFVLGSVCLRRASQEGLAAASWKLWERAAQLYRVNVAVALVVALVALVPHWDASAITTFVDRGSGTVYPLYPAAQTPMKQWIARLLLLRMGPHQIQILGLYSCLLALAPLALYLLSTGRTRWLLALSWLVYLLRWLQPIRLTDAQFEYAFPLLTWQLIFFHGFAAGYHRKALLEFHARHRGILFGTALLLSGAFLIFAWNSPNAFMPEYARLSMIPPELFGQIYGQLCSKRDLGLLRILNNAALLVVAGELLTRAWVPLRDALGWFFIPLGQASLYVFVVHVFVVMAASNLIPFGFSKEATPLLLTTVVHGACLACVWLMVRHKVLFRWIPR